MNDEGKISMDDSVKLMSLMSAKICHDFATPIGSIGLGMELLTPQEITTSKEIVQGSLKSATIRLKMYRLILSLSPKSPTYEDIMDFIDCIKEYNGLEIQSHNFNIEYIEPGPLAKLLVAVIYLGFESVQKGAKVTLEHYQKGFCLKAEGGSAQIRKDYQQVFNKTLGIDDQTPQTIYAFYMKLLAYQCRMNIHYTQQSATCFTLQIG